MLEALQSEPRSNTPTQFFDRAKPASVRHSSDTPPRPAQAMPKQPVTTVDHRYVGFLATDGESSFGTAMPRRIHFLQRGILCVIAPDGNTASRRRLVAITRTKVGYRGSGCGLFSFGMCSICDSISPDTVLGSAASTSAEM